MSPDPKTVREIARDALVIAIRRGGTEAVEAALIAHGVAGPVVGEKFDVYTNAVAAEYDRMAAALVRPDEQQPADVVTAEQQQDGAATARPRRVCLCGSTRFRSEFDAANRTLTLAGYIVLAPGVFAHSDGVPITEAEKTALDALHFAKIDLADEVFVVNPGGYIGASTANEIAYATKRGTPVRYLVEES